MSSVTSSTSFKSALPDVSKTNDKQSSVTEALDLAFGKLDTPLPAANLTSKALDTHKKDNSPLSRASSVANYVDETAKSVLTNSSSVVDEVVTVEVSPALDLAPNQATITKVNTPSDGKENPFMHEGVIECNGNQFSYKYHFIGTKADAELCLKAFIKDIEQRDELKGALGKGFDLKQDEDKGYTVTPSEKTPHPFTDESAKEICKIVHHFNTDEREARIALEKWMNPAPAEVNSAPPAAATAAPQSNTMTRAASPTASSPSLTPKPNSSLVFSRNFKATSGKDLGIKFSGYYGSIEDTDNHTYAYPVDENWNSIPHTPFDIPSAVKTRLNNKREALTPGDKEVPRTGVHEIEYGILRPIVFGKDPSANRKVLENFVTETLTHSYKKKKPIIVFPLLEVPEMTHLEVLKTIYNTAGKFAFDHAKKARNIQEIKVISTEEQGLSIKRDRNSKSQSTTAPQHWQEEDIQKLYSDALPKQDLPPVSDGDSDASTPDDDTKDPLNRRS
jgi:hypothetical protein